MRLLTLIKGIACNARTLLSAPLALNDPVRCSLSSLMCTADAPL